MSKFTDFLASLTGRPKNFDAATATLTEAKATLDSVAALFTAAGLNLEQMLAAGPDALKAHIESLDNSAELATALAEAEKWEKEADRIAADHKNAAELIAAHKDVFALIGLPKGGTYTAEEFKKAHEAHVKKATTLELSKTGHPPAHVPAATEQEPEAAKDPAAIYAEYQKMEAGELKKAFYAKHEAAIWAGKKLADSKA